MCFAAPCRCCECQGVHCFAWHPGHSHRSEPRTEFLSGDERVYTLSEITQLDHDGVLPEFHITPELARQIAEGVERELTKRLMIGDGSHTRNTDA